MASKAASDKDRRPATGTHHAPSPPSSAEPTGASLLSVLLVQTEALHEDELVRNELKKLGFRVKHQAREVSDKDTIDTRTT
ncbi:hypothetical protein Gpo141_00014671 [Globisporangium polare]